MSEQESIEKFIQFTGSDEATADFFLQAARNDLDAAVSSFFESDGMMPQDLPPPPPVPRPQPRPPPAAAGAPVPSSSARPTASRPRRPPMGGIATLSSLGRDDEDEDENENEYYAGGEKSGQMIQDPRRGDEDNAASAAEPQAPPGPAGLAESIFERARARGPRTDEEREQFEGPQRFSGAGYRLGQDADVPTEQPTVIGRRNVTRVLTFYANGFQVDDGPLRAFDDPANEAFLADVNRGVVPKEMEERGVGDVSITLVDKKEVEYVEQKKPMVPFSGGGQRLDGSSTSSTPAPAAVTAVDSDAAAAVLRVDETRAVTRIQIRLSDGTRLVARLNEDSTVGELRGFVQASRPNVSNFVLTTTFPRKVLDDDSKTIKEAQLLGAVVVQTLK